MRKFVIAILLAAFASSYGFVFAEGETEQTIDNSMDYKTSLVFDLEILSQDYEGNYHLEENVTRIDFLVALYQMMNYSERNETPMMQESGYNDVGMYHFASGYLGYMSNLGITKGYPDGTFRPDQPVTVEEAYLMAIKAAGYFRGNLDVGAKKTLDTAREIGLTKGISASLSDQLDKRNAAYLFYNLMFCDSLSDLTFENGKIKQSASEEFIDFYMNLSYDEGIINGVSGFSLYDGLITEDSLFLGEKELENHRELGMEYLGSHATVFYDQDSREVAAVMRKDRDNAYLSLKSEEIEDYANGTYEYYENGAGKTKRARLSENPDVLYNRYPSHDENLMNPEYGEVFLIDNNNDGRYEIVQVYSYESYLVESYTETDQARTVTMKNTDENGQRVILDLDAYERVRLMNEAGDTVSTKKFQADSVVTICRAEDQVLYAQIVQNQQEVKIRSVSREDGEERLTLEDASEILCVPGIYLSGIDKLAAGSYVLYLDVNGRAAMAVYGGGVGWRLAYILKCSFDAAENSIYLRLLDQDNVVAEYTVTDKITLDDVKYSSLETAFDEINAAYGGFKNGGQYEQVTTRAIRYYVNADNQIKKLDTPIRQNLYDNTTPAGYNENNKLMLRVKGKLYSKARGAMELVTIYQADAEPGFVGEVRAKDADKMTVFVVPTDDGSIDYANEYQAKPLSGTQIYAERWIVGAGYNTDPESLYSELAVIRKPISGEWADKRTYLFESAGEMVNDKDETVETGKFYTGGEDAQIMEFHENSPIQSYQLKKGDLVLASAHGNKVKVEEILYRIGGNGTLNSQSWFWDTQLNANHRLVRTTVDRKQDGYWVVNRDSTSVPDASIEPCALVTIYDEAQHKIYTGGSEDIHTKEIYGDAADVVIYRTSVGTTNMAFAFRKAN